MEHLKALQHVFNEESVKLEKYAKTIQVLHKDSKLKNQQEQQQTIQLAYTQKVLT